MHHRNFVNSNENVQILGHTGRLIISLRIIIFFILKILIYIKPKAGSVPVKLRCCSVLIILVQYIESVIFSMKKENQSQSPKRKMDGLTKCNIATYGTGHVFNDLAAACWFNYLLYYLKIVIRLSSAGAAYVHLAG